MKNAQAVVGKLQGTALGCFFRMRILMTGLIHPPSTPSRIPITNNSKLNYTPKVLSGMCNYYYELSIQRSGFE